MLKEVLQAILSGNITSKRDLAKRIGVQQETLDDMLRILTERGMLRLQECEPVNMPKCASCPASETGCSTDGLGLAYYVTERGKRYASR